MNIEEAKEAILEGNYAIVCEVIDGEGKVRHLEAMARLWLMRDEIANVLKANDDLLARYVPPTDEMAYARQDNTNLLVELGRGDEICAPSVFGEVKE